MFGDGSVGFQDNLGLDVIDQEETATFDNLTYATMSSISIVPKQKAVQSNVPLQMGDAASVHSMEV